jgi:Domain of unknown function (DUF4263)
MATVLDSVVFDAKTFEKELKAFETLLSSKANLSETEDIQPFFKKSKQLTAYMGTFAPNIGPATELCFEYEFFGDFKADVLLGSRKAKEFCVVEFEDGSQSTIFKKQPKRKNPEWSARFEHAFSQLTDWFYNLHDFKNTNGFASTFGTGHISFFGLLVMGRSTGLDDTKRNRLKWRTERVLIDSHPITCITFDDLHTFLQDRFTVYRAASKVETETHP